MRKIWDFHGGVHPPENKHQSMQAPIGDMPLADEYIVPLNQHIGAAALSCVDIGDQVKKGQLIADAQGVFSAAVHAPTSGEIIEIAERPIAHPSGLSATCIVIKPDGLDQWVELEPCEHYEQLDHSALVERIRRAGIAGMGGAGFPTAVKLNPRSDKPIDTMILNGTECEPYITADDALMRQYAEEIVAGAQLLAKVVGHPKNIIIGVEDNKPEALAALSKASEGTAIEVVSFPTKYPSGGEKQLIQILTGREVPSGHIPAQIGIVVQNVGTAYACWRAIRYGEPLIERITTVVGEALEQQRNVRVRVGTPMDFVLDHHGFRSEEAARLIVGGPMMGFAIEQTRVPVVKTTNCILAPSRQEMPPAPPAQACIRCGMCAEACPASLLPQQLYWYAQAEDFDKLQSHNLFDCIECGACSFVCPSSIPLVQYYRASKGAIRRNEEEKKQSDRARERFERRKQRIEKAEAEKEAKRAARKKAAEEAKKKLAAQAQSAAAKGTNGSPADVPQPTSTKAEPSAEQTLKKLERALQSAESRVQRLNKQIEEAEDEALKEKRRASLKQAELKVDEAKQKIASFEQDASANATPGQNQIQDAKALAAQSEIGASASDSIQKKMQASPLETQQKTLATLNKRIAVAEQKWQEAKDQGKPTVDALAQGVEKLKVKLEQAQTELAQLEREQGKNTGDSANSADTNTDSLEQNAAAKAIAKAQAKAAELAAMSDEEKRQAQITSLQARVDKAKQRLSAAQAENSEHVETFAATVEKLEQKLAALIAETEAQ